MDSSSSHGHAEENVVQILERMPEEGVENQAKICESSNLDMEKVDADETMIVRMKSVTSDKPVCEATSSTQIDVGGVKSSVAPGPANISLNSNETGEGNCDFPVKPTSAGIQPMHESCHVSESKDSSDDISNKDQNESNIEQLSKETDKVPSSVPMDTTDSSKKSDQKNEGNPSDAKDVHQETIEVSDSDSDSEDSESSSASSLMDTTDSRKKSNQKNEGNPSDAKDVYRETIEVSDSDSDSENFESSSVSSLSSPSRSECESDNDVECLTQPVKTKKKTYPVIKAKGELLPEDLPPIEELHISVPSSLCAEIGVVTSIVKTLVVIQSLKGLPALDLDSVLFLDSGCRALGLVFDVFGPVTEPLYCVRFNSEAQIAEYKVNPGDKVYYAPQTEHSKYVFLQQLMRMKGSDASKQNDLERQVQIEYSDDEEERKAWMQHGDEMRAEEEGLDQDQLKRKRDPNEVLEKKKKKKFALRFPPRNQTGGLDRGQSFQRTQPNYHQRPQYRQGPQYWKEQHQQYCPPPRHQGIIHPPSFNFPPPPIPGSSVQRQNPVPHTLENSSQGTYSRPFYQHPMQHQNASFGQLPFAQPQVDPRIAHFGAQFAQMVCNLQSPTAGGSVGAAPPSAPSFPVPYNQPLYSDRQSSYNEFYKPAPQGPPSTYSAPPFSAPPLVPQTNMPSTNVAPPGQPPFAPQPNQNATFGGQHSSTFSSYSNFR